MNGQDARSTRNLSFVEWGFGDFQEQARCLFHKDCISCGVGILPAFQEQARCLFHKDCISCGVGILPAHKDLLTLV
jgi:hypothetical protein